MLNGTNEENFEKLLVATYFFQFLNSELHAFEKKLLILLAKTKIVPFSYKKEYQTASIFLIEAMSGREYSFWCSFQTD